MDKQELIRQWSVLTGEAAEGEIRIAGEWASARSAVLLHISDTDRRYYDYYDRLIRAVKPTVLIHTGDLADEYKVCRIEGDREPWCDSAPIILESMRRSGAERKIICPGNNDLPEEIEKLAPDMEIVPRNTVLTWQGVRFALCHEVFRINAEAEIYLYGHGPSFETRTRDSNEVDGKRYFNGMWGPSLHCPATGEHLILHRPGY